ncbi:AAA family ATPase [Nonomuraea sp. NPDC050202]|uniref:AAA family ATPase n=1 Tax=Nonomuraea sp. NPDC050202 TaxID=3155035 RepID=UPI0033C91B5A
MERDESGAPFPTSQAPMGRLPIRVLGREEVLAELRDAVRTRDPHVHVLAGLGGSGKTTIALRLAADLADAGHLVWWVDASDHAQLTVLLLRAAQDDLDVPDGVVKETLAGRPARRQLRHLAVTATAVTRMLKLSVLAAHQLAEEALAATARPPRNDPALLGLQHSHATVLHRLGATTRPSACTGRCSRPSSSAWASTTPTPSGPVTPWPCCCVSGVT